MPKLVLGPSVESWSEPGATPLVPAVPGLVGVEFDTIPIAPGGVVNLKVKTPVNPGDEMFSKVTAVYVPLANLPIAEQQTAEWFVGSGFPSGSGVPVSSEKFTLSVLPAPAPATAYKVQTVIEYPDVPVPYVPPVVTPPVEAPAPTTPAPAV